MKTLATGLQAHLDSGATTLCWCWRITRADAQVQGFTDHDVDVNFDGTDFEAASGISASEVQSTLGLAVDNLAVMGALSSSAINEAAIAAGLYDNAEIEIWRVNWSAPDQRALMRKGTLGEIKRGVLGFEAEMRGLVQGLNQPAGRRFGRSCDADLGDARCGIDLADPAFKQSGTVASVTDARQFTASGLGAFADGWFSGGKLTWTSGANAGRAMEIKRHAVSAGVVGIELWQPMSEDISVADGFDVTAGCDKQLATCETKFSNIVNFRGFAHMPGNDAVLSYPARDQPLDGGSRFGN